MKTLGIAAKIRIGVGIFGAGFVLATGLGQMQGRSSHLANACVSVVPGLFP